MSANRPALLVVTDSRLIADHAKRAARDAGFATAAWASNERSALRRVQAEAFGVVLLDDGAPQPALDLMRQLRELPEASGAFVVLSSVAREEHVRALRDQGIAGYVAKPFSLASLVRVLSVARSQAAAAPHP